MKKQPERPVLITDAARSQADQFRSRQVRYVSMMSLRAACLILGAVLVSIRPPWLPVWLVLCAAGMVFLPWAAVLIANDRPAKSKAERAASELAAKQQAALAQHDAEMVEYLTIDVDPINTDPINTDPINTDPINTQSVNTKPIDTAPIDTGQRPPADRNRDKG